MIISHRIAQKFLGHLLSLFRNNELWTAHEYFATADETILESIRSIPLPEESRRVQPVQSNSLFGFWNTDHSQVLIKRRRAIRGHQSSFVINEVQFRKLGKEMEGNGKGETELMKRRRARNKTVAGNGRHYFFFFRIHPPSIQPSIFRELCVKDKGKISVKRMSGKERYGTVVRISSSHQFDRDWEKNALK